MSSGAERPVSAGAEGGEAVPAGSKLTTSAYRSVEPADKLRRQEEEIRLLRGKIKGYETLGALYQEKRKEVAKLKSRITELTGENSSSVMSLSVSSIKSDAGNKPGTSSQTEILDNGLLLQSPEDNQNPQVSAVPAEAAADVITGGGDVQLQKPLIPLPSEAGPEVTVPGETVPGETEEILSQAPPSPPRTDSLSYKIINSDGSTVSTVSRSSLQSDDGKNDFRLIHFTESISMGREMQTSGLQLEKQISNASDKVTSLRDDTSLRMDSNAELSLNTREELARVVMRGEMDTGMIKYILKSTKLEKQCKAKQALLENVIQENQKMKSRLSNLEGENARLRQKALIHDEAVHKKDALCEEQASPVPADWVHVERDTQQQASGGLRTLESTVKEVQLRKKVDRLKQHAQELLKANTSWDTYCSKIRKEFEDKHNKLKKELQQSQQKNEQYRVTEEARQEEMDKVTRAMNRRAERAEVERDEAVRALEQEQLRLQDRTQQAEIQKQRADLLEMQLNEQREIVQALTEERRSGLVSMQQGRNGGDNTEIQVLKQQVTIYKDDFDNERRDRERAQAEKIAVTEELDRTKAQLETAKEELREKQLELRRTADQKTDYQRRFREVNQELVRVQNILKAAQSLNPPYNPAHAQTTGISYPPQPPPPYENTSLLSAGRKWPCSTCTYDNPAMRVTCEMCGSQRRTDQGVPLPVEQLQNQSHCHHRFAHHGHGTRSGVDQCDEARPAVGPPATGPPIAGSPITGPPAGQRRPTQFQTFNLTETDDIDFDTTDEKR